MSPGRCYIDANMDRSLTCLPVLPQLASVIVTALSTKETNTLSFLLESTLPRHTDHPTPHPA